VRRPERGLCWAIARRPTTAIEQALDELGPLPVLTGTVASVRALATDPESSNEELVAAIEQDEAFAANVLRIANSASFARRFPATSLRHAIVILGRNELQRLAVAAQTYQFLQQVPGNGRIARGQMHLHALAVSSYAEAVARRCGASVDTAHLAGLLHDVGKLVLPVAFGESESESIALEFPNGSLRAAAERERLGVDHAYAGALLAGRSNTSDDVFEAITFHHGGRSGQESPTPEAACVQIGNCVVNMLAGFEPDLELLHVATMRVGLSPTVLDEVAEEVAGAAVHGVLDPLVKRVRTLERLAQTDALTGLANRRHWLEQVKAELTAAASGAVVICDLDRFKGVNDVYGHEAGDEVLMQFSRLLPEHGFAGRLGGDEFAIWIGGDVAVAEEAAALLIEVVQRTFDERYRLGLSLGIAPAPDCGETPIDLLRAADHALYEAKAAGRGRARVAFKHSVTERNIRQRR
jgi:diguanylate cyclase (GGDEF)-like protein/putative nucleotidyltransferase with HDIG domain